MPTDTFIEAPSESHSGSRFGCDLTRRCGSSGTSVPIQGEYNRFSLMNEHAASATSKFGFYPREGDYPVVVDESKSKFDQKIVRFV